MERPAAPASAPTWRRALLWALAAQGLLLAGLWSVEVFRPGPPPPPAPVDAPEMAAAAALPDTLAALAELEALAGPPSLPLDLSTAGFDRLEALPGFPTLPDFAQGGAPGAGGGLPLALLDLPPLDLAPAPAGAVQYLGLRAEARRVVLALDVSLTVVTKARRAGLPFEDLLTETLALVEALPEDGALGLILFAQNHTQLADALVPADAPGKARAAAWLRAHFRTDGRAGPGWRRGDPNGIEAVLRAALALGPEALFLVSDGDFQRRGWERVPWPDTLAAFAAGRAALPGPVRVHAVAFEPRPDDEAALRDWTAATGGQYRRFATPAP